LPQASPSAPPSSLGQAPGAAGRQGDLDRFAPGVAGGRDVRIEELRSLRRERVEDGGRRTIIEEPGGRTIVREGDRIIIRHDETDRFRRAYRDADVRVDRRGDEEVTIVRRPNGVEIVTVRNAEGNLIRRARREPGGIETVLIENEAQGRPRRRTVIEEIVDLPPPRVTIPRKKTWSRSSGLARTTWSKPSRPRRSSASSAATRSTKCAKATICANGSDASTWTRSLLISAPGGCRKTRSGR
jgi:hypothetical protein